MIRYAISRHPSSRCGRLSSNSSIRAPVVARIPHSDICHPHEFIIARHKTTTAAPGGSANAYRRRLQEDAPREETEGSQQQRTTTNRSPANRFSTPLKRPDFLSSLRNRKRPPIGENNSNNSPPSRIDRSQKRPTSHLEQLLRNGQKNQQQMLNQQPQQGQYRPTPRSPMSNLNRIPQSPTLRRAPPPTPSAASPNNKTTGTTSLKTKNNNAESTSSLVDFFHSRLQQVKQKNDNNIMSDNNMMSSSSSPSIMQPPPRRRPEGSFQATMQQARVVVQQQQQQQNSASIATPKLATTTPLETTTTNEEKKTSPSSWSSPIRDFVVQLQKQERQQHQQQQQPEPEVPSWRKSASQRIQEQHQQEQQQGGYQYWRQPNQQYQKPQGAASSSVRIQDDSNTVSPITKVETKQQPQKKVTPKELVVELPSHDVTVSELSALFRVKIKEIIRRLRDMGEEVPKKGDDSYTVDETICEMLAMDLDIKFTKSKKRNVDNDHEQLMKRRMASSLSADDEEEATAQEETESTTTTNYEALMPRPPVVCIMGHVDHGKTTLMDSLRSRSSLAGGGGKKKTKKSKKKNNKQKKAAVNGSVAGTEAGGITQKISAFQVPFDDKDDAITFLDTPGHAAFSAMRSSASYAADIIVLVVAADDGVAKQTVEILNFYKSIVKDSDGGITMVVAINKIDKPGVDVEESKRRITNQLLEHEIVAEEVATHESEYGAPVQVIPISAKTGAGIDDLIEGLALQSEVMDLRADDGARAEGIVMDSRQETGLGVVADCIVRWGSVQRGDVVVSGTNFGKVRALKDVNNKTLQKGSPSQPVQIVGFKTAPKGGDPFVVVASEQVADDLVTRRLASEAKQRGADQNDNPMAAFSQVVISGRESMTSAATERRLERYELDTDAHKDGPIRIPIIVKAKAEGSVAAVRDSLQDLSSECSFDINVDAIAEGVGMLTEGEVVMAKESNAAVFCFDIKNQDKAVVALAESEGVPIHEFDVIYSLLDHAKEVFTDYLPQTPFETVHGKAKVQAIFEISGGKEIVAGLKVLEGSIHKKTVAGAGPVGFRVLRDGKQLTPEKEMLEASSLRKFSKDVESVRHGEECGLSLDGMRDFEEGDIIECFSVEMKKVF